jgi:ferritin-like metal-binding protein YciE
MKGSNSTSSASSSSKKSKTLRDLLEDGLNDAYSAETQLVQALPKMAQAAENEELEEAFTKHLEQTKKHVSRLEKVYTHLGMSKGSETCEAMKGLIEEADEIISEYEQSAVRDSALIIAAQKVEHYEIAMYGSLCELADVLGYSKVCDILERTLEEEEQTDHLLTDIAMDVNDEAYEMSENEEEEEDDEDEE